MSTNNQEDDDTCDICFQADTYIDNNVLLFCDACNLCVHLKCYGIKSIPDDEWYCKSCIYKKSNNIVHLECCLCKNEGGALKPTDDGKWAHITCAQWVIETYISGNEKMEPIAVCKKSNTLGMLQCGFNSCFHSYHPICGFKAGFAMEQSPREEGGYAMFTYCGKHKHLLDNNTLAPGISKIILTSSNIYNCEPKDTFSTVSTSKNQKLDTMDVETDDDDIPLADLNKKRVVKHETSKLSKQPVSSPKVNNSDSKSHISSSKVFNQSTVIEKSPQVIPNYLDFIYRQAMECDVCGEIGITPLIKCRVCKVSVHSLCYSGCTETPLNWLCDRCDYYNGKLKSAKCTVCPFEEGAFKKTLKSVVAETGGKLDNFMHYDSGWIHAVCGLQTKRLTCSNNVFSDIELIDKTSFNLTCSICKQNFGSCIKCSSTNCNLRFHPRCGLHSNFFQTEITVPNSSSKVMTMFCLEHSSKKAISQEPLLLSRSNNPSLLQDHIIPTVKSKVVINDNEMKENTPPASPNNKKRKLDESLSKKVVESLKTVESKVISAPQRINALTKTVDKDYHDGLQFVIDWFQSKGIRSKGDNSESLNNVATGLSGPRRAEIRKLHSAYLDDVFSKYGTFKVYLEQDPGLFTTLIAKRNALFPDPIFSTRNNYTFKTFHGLSNKAYNILECANIFYRPEWFFQPTATWSMNTVGFSSNTTASDISLELCFDDDKIKFSCKEVSFFQNPIPPANLPTLNNEFKLRTKIKLDSSLKNIIGRPLMAAIMWLPKSFSFQMKINIDPETIDINEIYQLFTEGSYSNMFPSNLIDSDEYVAFFNVQEPMNVYSQSYTPNHSYSNFANAKPEKHYLEFSTSMLFNFDVYVVSINVLIQAVITHYLSLVNTSSREFRLFCAIDLKSLIIPSNNEPKDFKLRPYVEEFLYLMDKYYEITVCCELCHSSVSDIQKMIFSSMVNKYPSWNKKIICNPVPYSTLTSIDNKFKNLKHVFSFAHWSCWKNMIVVIDERPDTWVNDSKEGVYGISSYNAQNELVFKELTNDMFNIYKQFQEKVQNSCSEGVIDQFLKANVYECMEELTHAGKLISTKDNFFSNVKYH